VDDAGVAWRVVDEEAVVLHADSSAYFGLNQTATLLWTRLAEHGMTLDQLTTWIGSIFPDAPGDLEREVSGFLDQLLELGLIKRADSADGEPPDVAPAITSLATLAWEAPGVQRFGELEKLILSGE
jgi:PqqD family protein of HPr-rel-A system